MKYKLVNENFQSNYVRNLLHARGIENLEEYLDPSPNYLANPLNLKSIRVAAALYLRTVMNGGHILIIVDSDVDGYTSAAILYLYTKQVNCHCKIDYFLHEGKQHGLQDHIEKLMASNESYDLICLPDSSSNDAHYHDMLDEIHIPCLILDHHLTDVALSDNAVVVNNQLSPEYSNKDLTGAGVVYQFCRYLDTLLEANWADDYMDLAALGIVGDMGSMANMENRYIVKNGFSSIKNHFFKTLLQKQAYSITGSSDASWEQIESKLNPISAAFYIVPLVNALVRVGTMSEKELMFKAFINGSDMIPSGKRGAKGALDTISNEAARVCTNAKNHQTSIKESATESLEYKIFKYDLLENKVLFIPLTEEDKFPAELNGLIATQLADKYKKPTIVARLNNEGFYRGSARGLNNSELTDFKAFLTESGLFEYAQGHANAFGVSIPEVNLSKFHEYANEKLKDYNFGEKVYDVNFARSASASDMNALLTDINNYPGIWGQGTSEPLIYVSNIQIDSSAIQVMGKNADTVKIVYNNVAYMKFKATDFIEELKGYNGPITLNVIGKANLNEWCGNKTNQIFIQEYEIKENSVITF